VALTRDRHRTGEGQNGFHSSPSDRIICRLENQRDRFEFLVARRFRSSVQLIAAAAAVVRQSPDRPDAIQALLVGAHSAASVWCAGANAFSSRDGTNSSDNDF
jgi:hypothetical protein